MRGRSRFLSRFAVTAAASLTLVGASITGASPAQAWAEDCIAYLNHSGYSGTPLSAACHIGEFDMYACVQRLISHNVESGVANRACYFARF